MKGRLQSSSIPIRRSRARKGASKSTPAWTVRSAMEELRRCGSRRNIEGMARFGIVSKQVYGVSKPQLDAIARSIGKNHELGMRLWETRNHDARLLGVLISEPAKITAAQMEHWVKDFDNWDVCDGTCCHLFAASKRAWSRAFRWSKREREFEKRAGFALAAFLAVHDKQAEDSRFEKYLTVIEHEACDDRNFVRKAVNWALRNIGKRNLILNRAAIACAERIREQGSRAGRWIAADAVRELKSEAVQTRLRRKASV